MFGFVAVCAAPQVTTRMGRLEAGFRRSGRMVCGPGQALGGVGLRVVVTCAPAQAGETETLIT